MAVQIEDVALYGQVGQARLLLGFLQCDTGHVGVAIGVPAQLQPAVQLAVMGHEDAPAITADQPRAAGQMAFQPLADERVGRLVQQGQELGDDRFFVGPAAAVIGQVFS